MRPFNHFGEDKMEEWDVMTAFTIQFKGEEFLIQLICIFNKCPEYYFFIKEPKERACLMGKRKLPDGKPFWLSDLKQEDALELTWLIEQQTGLILPDKQTNNPFEYSGDIHIRIYSFKMKDVIIRKAKAPFGNDIYYQIKFDGGRTLTIGKFYRNKLKPRGEWWPVEPVADPKGLKPLISLVNSCELYNKWQLEAG